MQHSRWLFGFIATLASTLALGQVPGTIPPIKLPPTKLPVRLIPGLTEAIDAQQPFIARYAFCNAAQLYESRRMAWEPVYLDFGVSSTEVESYRRNIVLFFKDFCSERPGTFWRGALADIESFNRRIDEANAALMGVAVTDATLLRLARILAGLEEFRSRCLADSAAGSALDQDALTIFGSLLPATSGPPGLDLARQSTTQTLGRCGSKPGAGGFKSLGGADGSLAACMQNAFSQSATCDDPASEGPRGSAVARPTGEERCTNVGGLQTCSSGRVIDYENGARQEERRHTTTWRDAGTGAQHQIDVRQRDTFGSDGAYIGSRNETFVDGELEQFSTWPHAAPRTDLARDLAAGAPSGDQNIPLTPPAGFVAEVHQWSMSSGSSDFMPGTPAISGWRRLWVPAPAGGPTRRECQGVNPGGATPIGLAFVQRASDGGAPFRAGRLNTFDLMGQCLCTSLGRLGPQLAHQSGFSCGPDENTQRLDCLLNPRGPADGIRPECVGYLQADNPGRDTRTALNEWCGRVAQCPPGAGLASVSTATGVAMCSCGAGLAAPRGGGSSATAGAMCARVSCAGGSGAAGSDLYRQCCGAPGELPGTVDPSPGSPVPRPPDPGELPKQKLPPK